MKLALIKTTLQRLQVCMQRAQLDFIITPLQGITVYTHETCIDLDATPQSFPVYTQKA